jgi:G2/mitotic-specific cyclin-B, other
MYANYLVELALPEYSVLKYPYSMIAAAAVQVAGTAFGRADPFPYAAQRHSGYTEGAIAECAKWMAGLARKASGASLTAVYKKYSSDKYLSVARVDPVARMRS